MNRVTLLIGGNQGNRQALIEQATEQIRQRIGSVAALSRVYETEPWGDFENENSESAPLRSQAVSPLAPGRKIESFLNRALLVETTLSPWQVLRAALDIEAGLGRKRPDFSIFNFQFSIEKKYRSRPMDIDLIFYDDLVMDTPELTLPHPRMHLRRFVLEPLAEIMPDHLHPTLRKTIKHLLDEV